MPLARVRHPERGLEPVAQCAKHRAVIAVHRTRHDHHDRMQEIHRRFGVESLRSARLNRRCRQTSRSPACARPAPRPRGRQVFVAHRTRRKIGRFPGNPARNGRIPGRARRRRPRRTCLRPRSRKRMPGIASCIRRLLDHLGSQYKCVRSPWTSTILALKKPSSYQGDSLDQPWTVNDFKEQSLRACRLCCRVSIWAQCRQGVADGDGRKRYQLAPTLRSDPRDGLY